MKLKIQLLNVAILGLGGRVSVAERMVSGRVVASGWMVSLATYHCSSYLFLIHGSAFVAMKHLKLL